MRRSCGHPERSFNFPHQFSNAQLFPENVVGKLFGRKVLEVHLGAGVLAVKVAVGVQQFFCRHLPRLIVFLALVPPLDAVVELVELHGLGLGVILATFGQRLFVIPDILRRAGAVEKQNIGRDAGVRREHAIGQTHDGVKVELLEKFLLDARAYAVTKQRAVGHDDRGARRATWRQSAGA